MAQQTQQTARPTLSDVDAPPGAAARHSGWPIQTKPDHAGQPAQRAEPLATDQLRSGFVDPPADAAPGMRWWWFGPSVTRPELERELKAMRDAGFGGVEIAYVYPLAPATTEFGSDAFLADVLWAAEQAHRLGLRFDLTLGSGWPFGGPHISTQLAARQLHWEQREIGPGPLTVPAAATWPGDTLVAAYVGAGGLQESPETYQRLPVVDAQLMIEAGTGPRTVLLAYARLTGQNVKRAAVGAEGLVLDHYSAAATKAHLQAVGDPMLDTVPAELVGSVFCDSVEVYGADWTAALPAEFARRRGYDPLPELYRLTVDGPGAARLRADYHHTLSELYEENFVAVCQHWASRRGVPFRIQSYGTPPATISSYRFADLFEGEGWGWREITQTRWASSAAHLYGRKVVSAEVWTWVHTPAYRATPLDLKGEAHEHLLNGINQLFGHGWPYSPTDTPGMGWFFYSAGALDDRNPWWPAMPELNRYLTRLCWLLRQGEPVTDVALYLPNDDLFATMGRAQGGSLDTWREATQRIPDAIPATIRMAGLDYDLIDDDALAVTAPDRYRAVIVPATTMLPDLTATWFDKVVAAGGTLINIGSTAELPGARSVTPDGLSDALQSAVTPDLKISPLNPDIGFVHRRCLDADVYFVANTGPTTRTFTLVARTNAGGYEQWDPTLRVLRAGPLTDPIGLTLHPYQATVVVLHNQPVQQTPAHASVERRLALTNQWQVKYPDQPARSVELPHIWEEEPGRKHYSGAGTYTTNVELDPGASRAEIQFGECDVIFDDGSAEHGLVGPSYRAQVRPPVGEIANVRVNGIDCGLAWAPPYRVDISDALRSGTNEIEVTVFNTAANAVAADGHIARLAAESETRYGRRFRMQDLDQAIATTQSGLLHTPALVIAPSPRTP